MKKQPTFLYLLPSTICALGLMTCISNAQLPGTLSDGLVAYYGFNGNANDSVGNLNGEVNGGVTTSSDRFGNPNSAYMFNGSNGVIGPASPLTYPFALVSDSFTVSVWFKANQDDTLYPQSTDPTIRGHNFIVNPYWGGVWKRSRDWYKCWIEWDKPNRASQSIFSNRFNF